MRRVARHPTRVGHVARQQSRVSPRGRLGAACGGATARTAERGACGRRREEWPADPGRASLQRRRWRPLDALEARVGQSWASAQAHLQPAIETAEFADGIRVRIGVGSGDAAQLVLLDAQHKPRGPAAVGDVARRVDEVILPGTQQRARRAAEWPRAEARLEHLCCA